MKTRNRIRNSQVESTPASKLPRQAQTSEESTWLAGDSECSPQGAPVNNLKRAQVAMWLFIVAVIIISLLTGYLLWAKLSSRSPS